MEMDYYPKTLVFPVEYTLYILPPEIADHILYFTQNKVTELSQVCKYFNNNVKKIRITSNRNYRNISDQNLKELPNLIQFELENNFRITNEGVSKLTNLLSLNLSCNTVITNQGISTLHKLKYLDLNIFLKRCSKYNTNPSWYYILNWNFKITDRGISRLTNLTSLILSSNRHITDDGITNLTNLTRLDLGCNDKITDNGIIGLTNLTFINLERNHKITDNVIRSLLKLVKIVTRDGTYVPIEEY